MFKDPFDPNALLGRRCGCGGDHSESEHGRLVAEAVPAGEEARWSRVVDAAVVRAVFPVDAQRRLFLKTVGAATAMAVAGCRSAWTHGRSQSPTRVSMANAPWPGAGGHSTGSIRLLGRWPRPRRRRPA